MKSLSFLLGFSLTMLFGCQTSQYNTISIDKGVLADKIKGGWAGQVIGCTYGGPTEFRYKSQIIPADTIIPWDNSRMQWYFDEAPGLYDDVYMDLTFVQVFEQEGLDAPIMSHAKAFAEAEYPLWHANQAARYNILNGIEPPESGHWLNNPHADDIDFQIEADFAGLMSPGMVNVATAICDKIGHIMNYGDGWYGGVFVAAMYALAFIEDDINQLVDQALSALPEESTFHQCISDVIRWSSEYPDDWTKTWQACEEKWGRDIGCPDGVYSNFNIDAKINAAYIVIGLLYGQGDFGKTIDISTRCGQDSDCNPASAAGILGTMIGLDKIPGYWKLGLDLVEDRDFKFTNLSLNEASALSLKHAIENVIHHGGEEVENQLNIPVNEIRKVHLEQSFPEMQPTNKIDPDKKEGVLDSQNPSYQFSFEGTGFVVRGQSYGTGEDPVIRVTIDGEMHEKARLPLNWTKRRHELTWKYQLEPGHHKVELVFVNPAEGNQILVNSIILYGSPTVK